jgi:hypothetical protein
LYFFFLAGAPKTGTTARRSFPTVSSSAASLDHTECLEKPSPPKAGLGKDEVLFIPKATADPAAKAAKPPTALDYVIGRNSVGVEEEGR